LPDERVLNPFETGLRGRCPACGHGRLFSGFLSYAKQCNECHEDFEIEDAGDGPAVFVIFLAGFIIIPLSLAFHFKSGAPMWITMSIWIPILIIFCLALLRILRGIMFNLQWAHSAREVRSEDFEP
jgi:uncharacterized protein (DUF983 family)